MPSATDLIGKALPELATPIADSFVADGYTALKQHLLDVSVAERETVVEPDGVTDDGRRAGFI